MTRTSKIAGHWSGLCRKPPVACTMQMSVCMPSERTWAGLPGGGGPGSGAIGRGVGSALAAMRTLNRNRQLLFFTLLAGLVLAGNTVSQAAFFYIGYNLHIPLDSLACRFFIEFATLFCQVFLLAGLFLSIPSEKGCHASFTEGLASAKKYKKTIFQWSFILTLAGMLLVIVFSYVPAWFPTTVTLFLYHNGFGRFSSFLFDTLSRFPFNVSRLPPPDIFSEIPGNGGRSVLLWFYPGFREALIFSAINLFLLILTPFVVPLIVLGQKNLTGAVAGSFAMMKKAWADVAACAVFLGVAVFGVSLPFLFIQGVPALVMPLRTFYHPTDMWIALGLFYDFVLFSAAFVVATVGGIAALDLYTSVKTGQVPGLIGEESPR